MLDFHEKAKQLKSALNRLHVAKMAHKSASKVYNDAKVWRYNAEPEDYHWEQKSLQNLRETACKIKSIEAEIRRIKLARVLN